MVEGSCRNREEQGYSPISRRKFTLGMLLTALAGFFLSFLTLLRDLIPEKSEGGYASTIKPGDRLVHAQGVSMGAVVKANSLKEGDAILVFPAGKSSNPANLVQLIRLEEGVFKPPTRLDLTDAGFVAYSAICTHLGCTVSWVKNQQTPLDSSTECFCHNSIFDPARGAKVLAGPAPIPLAQIGVKVANDDGTLVFTSDFIGPIGPQVA